MGAKYPNQIPHHLRNNRGPVSPPPPPKKRTKPVFYFDERSECVSLSLFKQVEAENAQLRKKLEGQRGWLKEKAEHCELGFALKYGQEDDEGIPADVLADWATEFREQLAAIEEEPASDD